MTEAAPLLQVRGLVKHFPLRGGLIDRLQRRPAQVIRAVDGVDLTIREGETLALVGESGCGKSTTGRCILYLQDPTAGTVTYRGQADRPNQCRRNARAAQAAPDRFPGSELIAQSAHDRRPNAGRSACLS